MSKGLSIIIFIAFLPALLASLGELLFALFAISLFLIGWVLHKVGYNPPAVKEQVAPKPMRAQSPIVRKVNFCLSAFAIAIVIHQIFFT